MFKAYSTWIVKFFALVCGSQTRARTESLVASLYCILYPLQHAVQSDCRTCNYNILTSTSLLARFCQMLSCNKAVVQGSVLCNKTLDECNHQRCKSCTHWLHCCKRCTHGYLFKCPEIAKDQAAAPQRFIYLLCLGLGSADHYYLYLVLGGILSWPRAFGPRTTRPGGQLVLGPHVRGDIIWSGRHVVLLQRNRIPSSHPPSSRVTHPLSDTTTRTARYFSNRWTLCVHSGNISSYCKDKQDR